MPIYEYRCPDCSLEFEEIQKMSDDPVKVCPSCGKENVTKLLSAAAFHLKGGGWANDNYGLKSGGESGSGAASAPVSSSDSAPASTGGSDASTPAKASAPAPAAPSTPAPSSGGSSSGGE